jgi:hypothetical protein
MAEQNRAGQRPTDSRQPPRKRYSTPRLEEYGHVAKLTQSAGSSKTETGNPNMKNCL